MNEAQPDTTHADEQADLAERVAGEVPQPTSAQRERDKQDFLAEHVKVISVTMKRAQS